MRHGPREIKMHRSSRASFQLSRCGGDEFLSCAFHGKAEVPCHVGNQKRAFRAQISGMMRRARQRNQASTHFVISPVHAGN